MNSASREWGFGGGAARSERRSAEAAENPRKLRLPDNLAIFNAAYTFHTLLKPIVATNQSKGVMQNPHVSIPILRADMQLCLT